MGYLRSENQRLPAPVRPRGCLDGTTGWFGPPDPRAEKSVSSTRYSLPHRGPTKSRWVGTESGTILERHGCFHVPVRVEPVFDEATLVAWPDPQGPVVGEHLGQPAVAGTPSGPAAAKAFQPFHGGDCTDAWNDQGQRSRRGFTAPESRCVRDWWVAWTTRHSKVTSVMPACKL